MSKTQPTAEITAEALTHACEKAESHLLGVLTARREKYIACVVGYEKRFFWMRWKPYTAFDATKRWPAVDGRLYDHWDDDRPLQIPREDEWTYGRLSRIRALARLAGTDMIHEIRLPEDDIQRLRPYLNDEFNVTSEA